MTRDVMIVVYGTHTMRADRLISIVLLLQANGRMTAETLASRLEVSQRTILRDMDALSSAGVPVIAERGTGGGWRLIDGYETKLTGLTPAEIRSLFLARPPALLAELGIKEAADAAWLKLRAALPVGVREQAEFVRQRLLDRFARLARLRRVADELAHDPRGAVGRPPPEIPATRRPTASRAIARSIRSGSSRAATTGISSRREATSGGPTACRGSARPRSWPSRAFRPTGLRSRGVLGSFDESLSRAPAALRRDVPRDAAHPALGLLSKLASHRADPGRRAIPRLAALRFGRRSAAVRAWRSAPSSRSWSRRSFGSA